MMACMKNYRHITNEEREVIFLNLNLGKNCLQIGKILGRSHTSIKREIKRNSRINRDTGKLEYSPHKATELSVKRRRESKVKKIDSPGVKSYVIKKLGRRWSPEQIAGRLGVIASNVKMSHETIYAFIYSKETRDLRLWEFLRKGHKRRQIKFSRKVQNSRRLEIPARVWIEERPVEANKRVEFGHFETDLMEGKRSQTACVSVNADRKTGLLDLDKVANQKAETKQISLEKTLSDYPRSLVKTVTYDNGKENRNHLEIAKRFNCKTYFCHPYHSWEKGTVENSIGLVREYIPKGSDISILEEWEIRAVEYELNNRPRKRLGFYTPSEAVYKETGWCT